MIIKCRHCKREFDKASHRNQHERDKHQQVLPKTDAYRAAEAKRLGISDEVLDRLTEQEFRGY